MVAYFVPLVKIIPPVYLIDRTQADVMCMTNLAMYSGVSMLAMLGHAHAGTACEAIEALGVDPDRHECSHLFHQQG